MNNNEIALKSFDDACTIVKILLENDYVCMISNEEQLTILNYECSEYGDRNNIIFRNLADWEWEQDHQNNDNMGDCYND